MIVSNTHQNSLTNSLFEQGYELRKVLSYRDHERMGGKIAVWETVKVPTSPVDAKQQVERNLTHALNSEVDGSASSFANALANATDPVSEAAMVGDHSTDEGFGLGDLFDIVNPLQHIPLVNNIYREFTGDTIKPSSKMVGGAIYSGPVGVVAPLIDLVVQEETGQDTLAHLADAIADDAAQVDQLDQNTLPKRESNQMVSTEGAVKSMRTATRTIEDILAEQTQESLDSDFQSVLLRYSNLSEA